MDVTCRTCHGAIPPRRPGAGRPRRYCCDGCRQLAQRRSPAGLARAARAERRRRARQKSHCRTCGSSITGAGRRYCSWDCLPPGTKRSQSPRRIGPPEIDCRHCRAPLTSSAWARRYCSAHCLNRAAKRRLYAAGTRRHFPRIRYRERIAILDRDGWRCGICGGLIDRSLTWPHPGSPSIDHIDPNGAHEPTNWQASHLACNVQAGTKRAAA